MSLMPWNHVVAIVFAVLAVPWFLWFVWNEGYRQGVRDAALYIRYDDQPKPRGFE